MHRKWVVGILAALGVAFAPAYSTAASQSGYPGAVAAKTCRGYVKATIGGQTKCLRRGEYCAKAYKTQYRRYGFTCSGDPARLQ